MDGLTDKQIAHNIGITEQTLNVWKKQFPSFLEALKKGKEVVDREVENALFKRAIGYEYDEICEEYEDGVLTKKKITKKMVVPDTTAQIFWLKNRKPDQWKDKREQSISTKDGMLADLISGLKEPVEDDAE